MSERAAPDFKNCPLPDALETIGERWSFLILRGAMFGICHFEDFQASLGIARNILSSRLSHMVEKGILSRDVMPCDKRKVQYRLTPKGAALAPVMLALRQWAEVWERKSPCSPFLVDRRDGLPVRSIAILAHDGRPLSPDELRWMPEFRDGCCETDSAATPAKTTVLG